ncbi:undecaprenyl/decaprenyl-phosphate alpha-N-acetylglucosaminyl 1-phosphate transferase [Candidatus Acetothermia bacterium]|nr:undecaprenyl/decaprenyl-phosphate alpha-N-acetylglucosaminyl 1-phosphate transferase [Candidatus Acetothermia bacterium]MBI3643908.1 undecaprenyl/decaprenyl-phosphate alpha-N-acetylglucosaminyl 1-phosphate transferase [Candidatus Acetothermia bacterium]
MPTPIAVLILSFTITYWLAQGLLRFAPHWGLIDAPGERKPHRVGTPLGGAALVVGSLLPILIFASRGSNLWGWLCGALGVGLLGLWDDRWGVIPRIKLMGQILFALFPIFISGFSINSINIFGMSLELGIFAIPFTLFWIVGITNALNLIDGLDGLAVGAALAASTAIAILSIQSGNGLSLLLAAALFGGAISFLIFNHHPAKLFLGDGGSYYIGFTLALVSLTSLQAERSPLQEVPMLVPVVLLLYPILDTLWAIVRRMKAKKSIFQADQEHLHHQLFKKGWGYLKTIWLFYGVFAVLAVISAALFWVHL